jgi:ATP-dependent helicase/nuclease subunit A
VRGVAGAIDLLLDTPDGVVVIDHKTFPGGQPAWAQMATTFAPQMAAYAELLRAAGKTVLGAWVHFPMAGGVVRVV